MKTPDLSHVTIEQVTEAIEAVVKEAGEDYVYPIDHKKMVDGVGTCAYVHDGKPDCIAGRVFARLGASIEWLASYDDARGGTPADAVGTQAGLLATASKGLSAAQRAQDSGTSWGKALKVYHRYVESGPLR